ncbi:hypothetical protein [Desulfovibrio sp. Fe33]|nr:hypothetical protein [Desulfovibrio sp. Fe33]
MQNQNNEERKFVHESGVTYFSKRTERRVLFIMTLAMLGWGIVEYATNIF